MAILTGDDAAVDEFEDVDWKYLYDDAELYGDAELSDDLDLGDGESDSDPDETVE